MGTNTAQQKNIRQTFRIMPRELEDWGMRQVKMDTDTKLIAKEREN
jgi:hypothetical protein